MNNRSINILLILTILMASLTVLSAHGVDVTNDKMVIADDNNGQQVKDIADKENINISVYKFTSKDEVAHQLEHMLNNSNKYILVVSYQDTAQKFLKSHPEVSDRLIILNQYDDKSLSENMKKIADSATTNTIDSNILIISVMIIIIVLMIPSFYSLPIITALAFSFWGLGLWLDAAIRFKQRKKHVYQCLAAGSMCMALVAGCRPQFLVGSFLVFPIFIKLLKEHERLLCVTNVKMVLIGLMPYLIVATGLMYYNYIRFNSPFDFGANYNILSMI